MAPSRVSRRSVFIALGFSLLGACVFAVLLAFWGLGAHHGVARFVARIVPLPAAVVDDRIVWYHEVVERANALELLAGVPEDESMDRALMLAERYAVVLNVADTLGVDVDAVHVGATSPKRDALVGLREVAGWTGRDFFRYGVGALAIAEQVEGAVLGEPPAGAGAFEASARARLESIQLKYQQGIAFADLASEYGEGSAARTSGDIGYVDPESLPEELRTVAMTIAMDEVSEITETAFSFWLVKAEDVIENDDGTRSVWLRVIEVKKDLLGDIVDEQLKTARVREFLR